MQRQAFLLFLIGMRVFNLDMATLQTLIFLKMTVAGRMTIYLARTGAHHFWEQPLPSRVLFATAELTQVAGTFIVAYGIFVTPIGWGYAAFVWGYPLLSFVITDLLKIHYFRLMKHGEVKFAR
jgi:H+-transporting ATPase